MVQRLDADIKKALGINANKPLNQPESVCVEENSSGMPSAVKLKQRHPIITIKIIGVSMMRGGEVSRCHGYTMRLYWTRGEGWYFARTLLKSAGTSRRTDGANYSYN